MYHPGYRVSNGNACGNETSHHRPENTIIFAQTAFLIEDFCRFVQDHQPCVIFMDEIDAIGGSRFSEGTSADRWVAVARRSAVSHTGPDSTLE